MRNKNTALWVRAEVSDTAKLSELTTTYGVDFTGITGRAAYEENGFLVVPVEQIVREGDTYREVRLVAVWGKDVLITLETERLAALDALARDIENDCPNESENLFSRLLTFLNEAARGTVRRISLCLDDYNRKVTQASGGFESHGRQAGVADIAGMAVSLSEAEELVGKTVQGQLQLARAARWLRREVTDVRIAEELTALLSDIASLRRFALFQHEKLRNLQASMMTTLDLKQNQITKVFTVITAVFSPPTLVAAFYGQNFSYMPELAMPSAEWIVIAMTAVAAVIPMFYIKKKGWMR